MYHAASRMVNKSNNKLSLVKPLQIFSEESFYMYATHCAHCAAVLRLTYLFRSFSDFECEVVVVGFSLSCNCGIIGNC